MSRRRKVVSGIAVAIAAMSLAGLGVLLGRTVFGETDGGRDLVVATTTPAATGATSPSSPSATASPSGSGQATETPPAVVTAVAVESTLAPTAPATRPSTTGPAITVRALRPPVGTEITEESVRISVDVDYDAGPVSNVLGWMIYYCYGPSDCNTYSLRTAYDIQPGMAGSATLEGLFTSHSSASWPATICRLSVVIGHFLTPEVQWDSETADRPECHPRYATIRVLDVQPALNSLLAAGSTVSVNVQYDASPITLSPSSPPQVPPRIRVNYYASSCAAEAAASYVDLTPGTTGTITVKIPVAPSSAEKKLWHISASIISGDTTLAAYGFGPC